MKIPLVGGVLWAIVDDADSHLAEFSWFITNGYVCRTAYEHGQKRTVYLHREVLPDAGLLGVEVDHENRDKLDNRRQNLRAATRRQNAQNLPPKGGRSRFHGVGWDQNRQRWIAQVRLPDGTRWSRRFGDEFTAALAAEGVRFLAQSHAPPDPALGYWTIMAHREALAGAYGEVVRA